jgi:hypothetical protein
MTEPSVKCTRCAVTVPLKALDMPNRCTDPNCPVNKLRDGK